jgi:hypothetical protein
MASENEEREDPPAPSCPAFLHMAAGMFLGGLWQ